MPRRIAIVGAGFSGTVFAAHLLRRSTATATDVQIFERAAVVGPGLAYAARDYPYLLNVPAGRLSADSADPLQFLRFAQRVRREVDAEDFLPREIYGEYLQEVLRRAEESAPPQARLTRKFGEVTRISRSGEQFDIQFNDGERASADIVVLAVGQPAAPVAPWARGASDHPAYHGNAWQHPRTLGCEHTVVIVGSGLTMADIALSMSDDLEQTPRIISISRHGALPQPQTVFRSDTSLPDVGAALSSYRSTREMVAAIRRMARDLEAAGGDWRELLTVVRHRVPALWQQLPDAERRRFMRHARSYWDVHRHRMPPQLHSRLQSLRDRGTLEVHAGRILDMEAEGHRLRVRWRARAEHSLRCVTADAVINATGPKSSVKDTPDPLLRSLHADGLICEDDLELGLRTTATGACVAKDGTAHSSLYYLGPMLRASHWEATAAAELRDHAERLAQGLAASPS